MTKKEIPFEWTKKCEEIFQKIKTLLTTAPILALPIEDKDLLFIVMRLILVWGDVLMQDKNGVAYALLQFKVNERN